MNPPSEEEKEPEVQPVPPAKSPTPDGLTTRVIMSDVSKKYDVGNKGYLDEDERIMRTYDTNNDGSLDLAELKQIIQDLRKQKKEKKTFKKLTLGSSALLVVVLLANFGLIWAVVVLTRQVEMQNGKLVDSSTNKLATTKAEGTGLVANLNPMWSELMQDQEDEDSRRNLRAGITPTWVHPIRRLRADHEGVRKLQANGIILAEVANSAEYVLEAFQAYMSGTLTEANIVHPNNNTYSVSLASGIYHDVNNPTKCDRYWRNIMETGTDCPKYELECCDGTAVSETCVLRVYEICPATTG